ncbi:glycosyl transferase [Sphingomonas metalli]|uniref:Glycosyl transferase n=1 Tax=Sphingomonas metalli TaxID=1779358 RepID=A0A916T3Y0_9SPHN|nr:glycosyltransferase family 4 protein [Sphingomonas metalli]GGB27117.1 glycosyl transferase [Sphingomonas metalli]
MTKRRLLMTADSVGGVWQYAIDLADALARDHDVVIAHLGPAPDTAQRAALAARTSIRLVETGQRLDWLASDSAAVRAAARGVAELAQAIDADIVQLNSPALAGAYRFDRPVVAVDHGCVATWWDAVRPGEAPPAAMRWHVELVGQGLRAADCVVTPTAAYGEAVRRCYALPFAPLAVHNGRTRLTRPEGVPTRRAFTAGRLWDAAKSTPLLDAVAARLPIPFVAAGPATAPYGEAVTLDHLCHLGTLGEHGLARQLAQRPVFVSAARFEPFGLAVLEAASAGCPLVLSDIPAFRELWDGAAHFVAGEAPDDWARAIMALADDPHEAAWLGQAAAARAARRTPAAMAEGMRAAFARVAPPARLRERAA